MPYDYHCGRQDSNDDPDRMPDHAELVRHQHAQRSAVSDSRFITGLQPAAVCPREPQKPRTPTAAEQFREHSGALLFCLEWNDVFPTSILEQWRDHIVALDIGRPKASLRLLAALSESYDEARRRFKPDMTNVRHSMQFAEQSPRIGREIDKLIRILERVLAYETRYESVR